MSSLLTLVDLAKSFDGLRAVDGVSLKVERGSIAGLIGPNGSGKTTLFHTITGIETPDHGKVYFNEERIDGLPPNDIYERGLVRSFQIPRLFNKMTVLDNMIIAGRDQIGDNLSDVVLRRHRWMEQEKELRERALDILEFMELKHLKDAYPNQISGGQIKLLEIGRTLMSKPQMLLLDEPAAGVNPTLADQIFEKILDLRDVQGPTFLIIEHRIELLLNIVDQVFVMNKGRIISEGKPDEIKLDKRVVEAYLGE